MWQITLQVRFGRQVAAAGGGWRPSPGLGNIPPAELPIQTAGCCTLFPSARCMPLEDLAVKSWPAESIVCRLMRYLTRGSGGYWRGALSSSPLWLTLSLCVSGGGQHHRQEGRDCQAFSRGGECALLCQLDEALFLGARTRRVARSQRKQIRVSTLCDPQGWSPFCWLSIFATETNAHRSGLFCLLFCVAQKRSRNER